jgi:hypothetical protein
VPASEGIRRLSLSLAKEKIMHINLRHAVSGLAAVAALVAFELPAMAAPNPAVATPNSVAATRAEQRALDSIIRAQIDLSHHLDKAAMHRTAVAETVLLNEQQSGAYHDPRTLAALERSHADIMQGRYKAARVALHKAEADLRTPRAS